MCKFSLDNLNSNSESVRGLGISLPVHSLSFFFSKPVFHKIKVSNLNLKSIHFCCCAKSFYEKMINKFP